MVYRSLHNFLLCRLLLYCLVAAPTLAQATERNRDVPLYGTFIFENDDFVIEDGGYSSGLAYNWMYGPFDSFEGRAPSWVDALGRHLYTATGPDQQRLISYAVAQEIYTPEQTKIRDPDPDDRPYAGLVLWQVNWFAYSPQRADILGLELGMVGSVSLGEQTQKAIHEVTGANKPRGWGEQLNNEPIFRFSAQRNWRLHESSLGRTEFDVIGIGSAAAGTRRSDLGTGLAFRLGRGLHTSLANATYNPGRAVNLMARRPSDWSAFMVVDGGYVFNDITLDGNTFEHSASVSLEHWQAAATLGAAWHLGNLGWLFTLRRISDEFETQQDGSLFGALNVTYQFDRQ